MRSCQG